MIRVRVHAQWNSGPKTQYSLLYPGLSCPHSDEVRKSRTLSLSFLVVIQERYLRKPSLFLVPDCIFTHSEVYVGLPRTRNTNLCELVSETMSLISHTGYPHILIELLSVLILLKPHIHFSSFSSLHYSQHTKT
jgi:hypothetical protein